jgi:ELWxxDGT repeat protein
MHALGKRLIFLSGVNSKELWVSNGTAAGTQQIYNIGEAGLSGASMVTAAGQVFIARGWEYGGTLWRTNGTNAGTEPVGPGDYPALPTMLTSVGDELCFAAPDWNTFQWALWETDGSWYPPATYSVASFLLPWEGVAPAAELNGALIFNGDDGVSGAELWSYTP